MNQQLKTPTLSTAWRPFRKAYAFFEEVKVEFWKIQWTEKEELRTSAQVVVVATFVLGMIIYLADLVIQRLLGGLEGIFQWLVG